MIVVERAYAKINLSLDVLGTRADGYHELRSVMQTISLHDVLTVRLASGDSAQMDSTSRDFSLVDNAIAATACAAGFDGKVTYNLEKRIPMGAGLGGGSSDAVAAIRATRRLIEQIRGLRVDIDTQKIAESLGSDVPFFLKGGIALVEGRGERVTPLEDAPERWLVLVSGKEAVSTTAVFEEVTAEDYGDGHGTDRVIDALHGGEVSFGGNDLTPAAVRLFPHINRSFKALSVTGPTKTVAMTGSGGTVVGIYRSRAEAETARARAAASSGPWVETAITISRDFP